MRYAALGLLKFVGALAAMLAFSAIVAGIAYGIAQIYLNLPHAIGVPIFIILALAFFALMVILSRPRE